MKRVRGIGETRGHVTPRLGFVEMRMKHDVRAAPCGPAHRFRIPPALVADHHAKRQRPRLENPPAGAGRIDTLLGRVDLDFVLETGNRSVRMDHGRGGQQSAIDDAIKRIRKAGKAPGILAPVEADARRYLESGCLFVAVGADVGLLARESEKLCAKFKS